MKSNNVGFTLIELLVVVLIIGILAAIALPQYTKAVERSRISEAVQKLGDLATAQQIFYMQNNAFADDISGNDTTKKYLNDGDITFSTADFPKEAGSGTWYYTFGTPTANSTYISATRDGGMYNGQWLEVRLWKDGSVWKCQDGGNAFDGLATTAGYKMCH